ncbi:MAG: MFS transporter [Pseudomonadota bacterium]
MTTITRSDGRPNWLRPTVVTNFFLGFSSGLPFPLVYATLTAWLEDASIARSTISTFAWIGFAYSFKYLWAPLIDAVDVPLLTRWLGRRRAWLIVAQMSIALGLVSMAFTDPSRALLPFTLSAIAVALLSATQDIIIDAYRIESDHADMQGVLAAAYQYGYRIALIASTAGALLLADTQSWSIAYLCMAVLMGVGVTAVLFSPEPKRAPRKPIAQWSTRLRVAFIDPFLEFFQRVGWVALLILAYIFFYRVSDYVLGVLANPFYLDIGFTKSDVAGVAKVYGTFVSLVGIAAGGVAVLKLGIYRSLIVASVLIAATNLGFLYLAFQGPEVSALAVTISGDNFAQGFSGTVLIAYLASLTNTAFTATQYALFSSISVFLGKFLAKFSGNVQEWSGWAGVFADYMTSPVRDADWAGWIGFFSYAALTGIPSIILACIVAIPRLRPAPVSDDSATPT